MSVSVGELILREILGEIIVNKNVLFNYRGLSELINETGHPLELDIYYPDLKLAFEFQGEQHYKATTFADKDTVEQIKKRDEIKIKKCISNGITLIAINGLELGMCERSKLRKLRSDVEQTKSNFQQARNLAGKGKRYRVYLNKKFPDITSTKSDVRVWREDMKKRGIEIPQALRRKSSIPDEVKCIVESGKYEDWKANLEKQIKHYEEKGKYLPKEIRKYLYCI